MTFHAHWRKASDCTTTAWLVAALLIAGAPGLRAQNPASSPRKAVLDRVVAVVGNQAILASDVDDEMRFAQFQPGPESAADNTPQCALQRVMDRTLIDQQRQLQPGVAEVSKQQLMQAMADLRKTIPLCAHGACQTDTAWKSLLAAHGFTQQEIEDHLRQRLAILKFVDLRFGVAARASSADVRKYYDDVLLPALEREHAAVPPLNSVSSRIREILRQQQVDELVDQWVKGMRSETAVRIVDPAYRTSRDSTAAEATQ
jgi:hypothetical protein